MKKGHRWNVLPRVCSLSCCFMVLLMVTGCGNRLSLEEKIEQSISSQTDLPQKERSEKNVDSEGTEQLSKIAPIAGSQEMEHIDGAEVSEQQNSTSQEEKEAEREQIGLGEEDLARLKEKQTGNYYYELLNDPGKTMYVEMLQILLCQAKDIKLSGKDLDNLGMVYQCVINDHPELFYLSGYTYVSHKIGDELKYITFSGSYLYDSEIIRQRNDAVEAKAKEILDRIPAGTDSYGIVKYIYEYVILNTEYSFDSADNQNICSVFLEQKSVCNGYAKAVQYLLQKEGIPCILVVGQAGGGSHAWNIVQIDGAYYCIDATWGDPSYYNDAQEGAVTPDIDYSYLCITTDEISRTHTPDPAYPLPVCSSRSANYFVREGLYFDSVDEGRLRAIFGEAENDPDKVVILKASDENVYHALFQHLITEENIFQYYRVYDGNGNMTVSYSENDNTNTLSFWH